MAWSYAFASADAILNGYWVEGYYMKPKYYVLLITRWLVTRQMLKALLGASSILIVHIY